MDSSKFMEDYGTGESQRIELVAKWLNPALRKRNSKVRIFKPSDDEGKGLHYYVLDYEAYVAGPGMPRGQMRRKIHFRRSDLRLYLKMPSRHTDPEEFLKQEKDSLFVFYEVDSDGKITGRFGEKPVSVTEVREHHLYSIGGISNENSIDFVNYPLGSITYTKLDEPRGFVEFNLLEALEKDYENLLCDVAVRSNPWKSPDREGS